jgi:hypothetical protein
MLFRTSELPAEENRCPECGLNVSVSAGVERPPIGDTASWCKHGSWRKCPKLNMEELRRAARRRADALQRA